MNRYKVVVENCTDAYILDIEKNEIVTLCNTKRPDLGFEKLKELVAKANRYDELEKTYYVHLLVGEV